MKPSDQISILKTLTKENAPGILISIVRHKARSPSQLALELELQPTQVHRVLDDMVKVGLITRQAENPTPARSWVFYRPTHKGKEAVRLLMPERLK